MEPACWTEKKDSAHKIVPWRMLESTWNLRANHAPTPIPMFASSASSNSRAPSRPWQGRHQESCRSAHPAHGGRSLAVGTRQHSSPPTYAHAKHRQAHEALLRLCSSVMHRVARVATIAKSQRRDDRDWWRAKPSPLRLISSSVSFRSPIRVGRPHGMLNKFGTDTIARVLYLAPRSPKGTGRPVRVFI